MSWILILVIILFASPVAAAVTGLLITAYRAARWQANATTDQLGVISSRR